MKATKISIPKVILTILSIILFQPFWCPAHSQQDRPVVISPVMKVRSLRSNTESPVRLDRLNVDIKVVGQVAITTLDMTYYNPNSRVMEGEFNFPLGAGQTVSRFALDINGSLRDGVVVEKEQGRKTFEAIVRRGVDPGLLEKTAGNNFRMRVYPLPAKGTRRVVIAFEQELAGKGNHDLYLLPLNIVDSIAHFSLRAEVIKNSVKLDAENNELPNLSFDKWNDSYVAEFKQENFVPDKQIALAFPHTGNGERVFTAAKNNSSDSSYFYVDIRPEATVQPKALPKRITLLWDNSNSAQNRNVEKELAVLGSYIQKIQNVTIDLLPFNIKMGKLKTFEISNGNWHQLKLALEAMVYDGGTSLGCIDFTKFVSDEVLLFSDGMSTFGSTEPRLAQTPVYTLNSNLTANPAFLTYLARQSGGMFLDLNKLTAGEVTAKLTNNDFHFISARVKDGQVADVYPSMPCQLDKTFSIAGTMHGKSATLVLNFGFGKTITYSKTISIQADNSTSPDILGRIWAEKKIEELGFNEEKNKSEITRTGKEFGIVTANTSLIVLESLNDYVNYDIVPPVEMRKDYFAILNAREKESTDKIKEHIEYVAGLSDEQSKWWNKNFAYIPKTANGKLSGRTQFTAPVIKMDEEVSSQEEISVSASSISIADVKSNDEVFGSTSAVVQENVIMSPRGNIQSENNPEIIPTIELNAWDPQTPYLKVLQYASAGSEYITYLKLKKEYGTTPAFYMDAAGFFAKAGKKDTAVTVLSNLAELRIESPQLLRVLGNKLLDFKCYAEAVTVLGKVLELKGEEPQSYRDLGLAYEANGNHQQAINTLYEVVKRNWDNRFPEIELIVLNEINNIIALYPALDYSFIDKRLIKKEPVSIRVILTWDTDNCDMDLWVTDPNGEKCFFQHTLTRTGGKISRDFTGGYGPEEFMIRRAVSGKYSVQANYYGTQSQILLAPVNLHLVFITNFGKPNQKKQEITIRLDNKQEVIDVGKFSYAIK